MIVTSGDCALRYDGAYLIEDATLIKLPAEGVTRIHVRFKSGKTATLTTLNPKPAPSCNVHTQTPAPYYSSAQQVKTPPLIVQFVDKLLDDHIYAEIADILNQQELRPGGSARPGRSHTRFTALRVAYLVHRYALRSRYNRLRDRGMLMAAEAATRLGIHEATVVHWAEYGMITRHAYNAHAHLYELSPSPPAKHCSRWDQLSDRAAAFKTGKESRPSDSIERGVV